MAFAACVSVGVLTVDREPGAAFIVVSCGCPACLSAMASLTGGDAASFDYRRATHLGSAGASVVLLGVLAALRGGPPLAVFGIAVTGGVYFTSAVEIFRNAARSGGAPAA